MKSLLVLGLLVSPLAHATSPYTGPWVEKLVGVRGQPGAKTCLVTPSSVRKIYGENLDESMPLHDVDGAQFSANVVAAAKEPVVHAVHFMATNPPVTISAGFQSYGVANYIVSKDASAYDYRDGSAAQALIELVDKLCDDDR